MFFHFCFFLTNHIISSESVRASMTHCRVVRWPMLHKPTIFGLAIDRRLQNLTTITIPPKKLHSASLRQMLYNATQFPQDFQTRQFCVGETGTLGFLPWNRFWKWLCIISIFLKKLLSIQGGCVEQTKLSYCLEVCGVFLQDIPDI